ncbi:MAG: hypothetical protein IKO47_01125 [Ruminococcus sp.]|nr:hypothetical protein [Ruminococcus sp.]
MWICPKCETHNRDGDMNCFICACKYQPSYDFEKVKKKEASEAAARVRAEKAADRAKSAAEAAKKDQRRSTAAKKPAYTPPPKTKAETKPAAAAKPPERKSEAKSTSTSVKPAEKPAASSPKPASTSSGNGITLWTIIKIIAAIWLLYLIFKNDSPSGSNSSSSKSALYPAAYVCEQLEYAPDGEYFSLCLSPADTSYMISEEDSYVDLSEM